MKITKTEHLNAIMQVVDNCRQAVWIESAHGERFDMKNTQDRIRGFARLLDDDKEELEFFANEVDDQLRIAKLLYSLSRQSKSPAH